ncbi:MAG: MFS transporter [Myxococcales bacterium]|nr:MFS transporter [Myxococcales bacterium]
MGKAALLSPAFVLAFVGNLLHSLAFFAFLHLPGFLTQIGADELMIGVIVGLMSASAIAARPGIGWLMDRRGRHVVVRIASVVHVAVCLSYLLVDEVGPLLIVIRLVHGVAEGALFSALFTIAADVTPPARRTEGIALFGISGLLPIALAGLLGDAILQRADYATLFLCAALMALLGGVCSWLLADSRPADDGLHEPARSFLAIAALPQLRPPLVLAFGFAVAISSYFTFLKTYVEHTGIGSLGLFYSAFSVAAILLRFGLGWVPDRLGPARTLVPAMLVSVGGLLALAWARDDNGVIAAGLLCGTGHAFVFPIVMSLAVARTASRERGAALALFTAMFDLGILIGSPLLGALLERTDYPTMFAVASGVAALVGLAFAVWDRRVAPLE